MAAIDVRETRRIKPRAQYFRNFVTLLPLRTDGIVADSLGTTKEVSYLSNRLPSRVGRYLYMLETTVLSSLAAMIQGTRDDVYSGTG